MRHSLITGARNILTIAENHYEQQERGNRRMSEPVVINETAVTIISEITDIYRVMVEHWIQDALNGTEPLPADTPEYRVWTAYRVAVAMAEAVSQAESGEG